MSDKKEGKTLEVEVNDTIGVSEAPTEEKGKTFEETREEIIKKVLERKVFLAGKYVKPHSKVARPVEEKDIPKLLEDAKVMHEMCLVGRADYSTAYAIAHTQIEEKDPMSFYVTMEGQIIINPVIVRYTHQLIEKREGCMSYPEEPMKTVLRFHKITLRYQTLSQKVKKGKITGEPQLTKVVVSEYAGQESQVIQHECSHLLGHNIYDKDYSAVGAVSEEFIDSKPFTTG